VDVIEAVLRFQSGLAVVTGFQRLYKVVKVLKWRSAIASSEIVTVEQGRGWGDNVTWLKPLLGDELSRINHSSRICPVATHGEPPMLQPMSDYAEAAKNRYGTWNCPINHVTE
jgi:hypothetical protein